MDQLNSSAVEELIDLIFDRVVPNQQYKVLTAEEYVPCQRSVVHVHEMPEGYYTPFSDVSYDYKMQAIEASQFPHKMNCNAFISVAVRLGLSWRVTENVVTFLWPYLDGAPIYEAAKKLPVLNMRAFVATYRYMGWPATADYEY